MEVWKSCPHCGAQLPDAASFCPHCAQNISERKEVTPPRHMPRFSVFLAIFHVLKCIFLIFRDFQFSRHIPGPSV
ncbi:MAG: zinc ribbon domain-containing protein, partial [Lawsonibacter sp.]|nr:zinc ribbon domain-containing protein [Lawsonibacter sp.]